MRARELLEVRDTYCLRGVAMLMIIVGHTQNGYPVGSEGHSFPAWLGRLQMEQWGGMGVAVFLFLSGYGLFYTLERGMAIDGRYVWSKVRRLFEPFVLYWMVELVVLALVRPGDLGMHVVREVLTFGIHPDVENWFFKVIVVTYVVTLLLFKCQMRSAVRLALVAGLTVVYVVAMRALGFGPWWYNTVLCFPFGALVASRREWFAKRNAVVMSALGACLALGVFVVQRNSELFYLAFMLFVIYALRLVNIRSRLLHYIGYNSFIFYFMECPVMDELVMFSYPNYPLYCALSVVGTFLLSWLCVTCRNRLCA